MRTKLLIGKVLQAALFGLLVATLGQWNYAKERDNPRVEEMTAARAIDRQIIKNVAKYMRDAHLSKHKLDDEISSRAFDQFLRTFDPLKMYFLQSDIDALSANRQKLDDFALSGDMGFAIETFKLFLKRVDQRVAMAQEEIDAQHDFSVDEQLPIDKDVFKYPKDETEARDRMRRQIKYQFLLLESEKVRSKKDKPVDEKTRREQIARDGDPNEDPRERLHRRYRTVLKRWHQMDADELLEAYITALTTSFDPHTTFMSPKTLNDFKITMGLRLEGIGAQLMSEDGYTKLTSIVPGGAADKDGRLKSGDRIISVGQGEEGKLDDVIDMKLQDVVSKIRGSAGTVVRLGVIPASGGEAQVYNIVRAKINLEDSAARSEIVTQGVKADGSPFRYGYIDLPSFYLDMEAARENADGFRSTTRDMRNILIGFRNEKVDAVVVDLSANGGGSLTEAINATGLFIDRGPVVQVKDPGGQVQVYQDEESGVAWSGPLVVLTSKESASASEIFAGAIQDYKRGLVIGDPTTHGKGTVQSLRDIGAELTGIDGSMGALKITIQQFYLPDGKSTQRQGVMSDIVLPALTASFDNSEADLEYALPNDQVQKTNHADYKMVNSTLLSELRSKSQERIKNSAGFDRLLRRIELFRQQKSEDFVSLNKDKFMKRREEIDAEQEVEDKILEQQMPKKEVFKKDYYHEEVLNITRDYIEAVDQLNLARAG
jgi:carboxyl-terminal processing protease